MKIIRLYKRWFWHNFGRMWNSLNAQSYMSHYTKYLKGIGVNIIGKPAYISSDAYFDSHDYSQITVGNSTTISMEVLLLTHDYSLARGIQALQSKSSTPWNSNHTPYFLKPITIGDNCFIGARTTLLPGTIIGNNCIIGACSVVKGNIPDNSIVVGNPAKVIKKTTDWAQQHIIANDYII